MILDLLHHAICSKPLARASRAAGKGHLLDSILLLLARVAIAAIGLLRKVHEGIAALPELLVASTLPIVTQTVV